MSPGRDGRNVGRRVENTSLSLNMSLGILLVNIPSDILVGNDILLIKHLFIW